MSSDEPTPQKKIVFKKRAPGSAARKKKRKPLAKLKKKPVAEAEAPTPAEEEALVPTEGLPAPEPSLPAAETPPPAEEDEEHWQFFCPYCAEPNRVTYEKVGEVISCAACGNPLTIPPPLAAPREDGSSKKKSQKITFKFFCSICGQKLSATAEQAGAKTVCPSCNSSITVPGNQPPPPDSSDTSPGTHTAADVFKFHCPHCRKKFEARRAWAGRPFQCPDCQTEVLVPEAGGQA